MDDEMPRRITAAGNMGILFAIGGKVRDMRSDATAFEHRNADCIFEATSDGAMAAPRPLSCMSQA
jgi:hypothetical protein